MIRSFSLLSVALSAVLLQACVFAPGQYLDRGELRREGSAEASRVELIPITPKLLAMDAATARNEALPAELLGFVPPEYRIGPGDLLYITVWDHPELTTPSGAQQPADANGRLVRPDGSVFYPYLGNVKVAGRTIEEVRAEIAGRLKEFVESPQVDLAVTRFASQRVVLSGAFKTAGPQPITNTPLSLMAAIGAAGVEAGTADLSAVVLRRDGREYRLDLDALNVTQSALYDIYLKAGDQIYVPYNDRKKVYLMGEVLKPSALPYKTRNITLAEALGTVGGLDQTTSDGKAVYVIRGVQDLEREPAKVFALDAQSPTAFVLAQNFTLADQDVVFVGPAGITRWNRFISQLLPSSSLLGAGANIRNDLLTK